LRTFHRTLENAELMPESDHLNFKGCTAADAISCGRRGWRITQMLG
jgi:hypothetical protein